MLQVVRDSIITFNSAFEAYVDHMYLDVKGYVTVGVGNLLPSPDAAASLPFTRGVGGPPATADEIRAGWQALNDAQDQKGRAVSARGDDAYTAITDLRLSEDAVNKLVMKTANMFDAQNSRVFPGYEDLAADAQLGLMSMQWPGFKNFNKFTQHVKDGHWFGAARECYFDETGNPGLKPRNQANRRLFSYAGRVATMNLDPKTLYYYNPGANKVYFFKDSKYIRYDWDSDAVDDGGATDLTAWHLPDPFSSGVDAVFNGLGEYKTPKRFGRTYFFRDSDYVTYDWDSDTVDYGPAKLTEWGLKDWGPAGDFTTKIDAAVNGEGRYFGKLYLFKGKYYVRYDWKTEKLDQEPNLIAAEWGLPEPFASGIDAVVSGEGPWAGKLYFFKDSQYIRCQWDPYKVDGPVTDISPAWNGLGDLGFASALGAACNPPGRS